MVQKCLFLIVFACLLSSAATGATRTTSKVCLVTTQAICTRVMDGDTIVLDGTEKLRLCGIDTPEIFSYGRLKKHPPAIGLESRDFVTSLALGQRLKVDLQGRRDRYGRLLGWAWLPDGKLLNAEIARCGFAVTAKGCSPRATMKLIDDASNEAKQCREGIWKLKP